MTDQQGGITTLDAKTLAVSGQITKTVDTAAAEAAYCRYSMRKPLPISTTLPIGKRCWHFTFTPDAKHIVAACGRSGALSVVDPVALTAGEPIGGFNIPWGIVAYPNAAGTLDVAEK